MTVEIDNIFDAIATSPEDAADLKLRSSMMDLVKTKLAELHLKGTKARDKLQLDTEHWSYFKQGGISFFTPGKLAHMLELLGHTVTVCAE